MPTPPPPGSAQSPMNPGDVSLLARLIASEAGEYSPAEQRAVAWTMRNRMRRHPTNRLADVISAGKFSTHLAANAVNIQIAQEVQAAAPAADPTRGATHYYSPVAMPEEGESTAGFDVKGGLESTSGLTRKNYRPGFVNTFMAVAVPGVQDKHFKFYQQPGAGRAV